MTKNCKNLQMKKNQTVCGTKLQFTYPYASIKGRWYRKIRGVGKDTIKEL
jgi:hypothetical protein